MEVLAGLSSPCNGSGAMGLWQREEESMGVDAQALFGAAASGQKGEQQAHCAPTSVLPFPPGQCCWDAKELPDHLWLRRAL